MRKLLVLAVTFALAALLPAGASANSIVLTQEGWSSGATLTVEFTGEDIDGDGAILLPELSFFNSVWSIPLGDSTTWGLADVLPDGFVFTNPGNYLIFVSNADFSLVSSAFEGDALASVFDSLLFPVDNTATPAVAAVPEPAGLGVAGLILLSVGMIRRSKRSRGKGPSRECN